MQLNGRSASEKVIGFSGSSSPYIGGESHVDLKVRSRDERSPYYEAGSRQIFQLGFFWNSSAVDVVVPISIQ